MYCNPITKVDGYDFQEVTISEENQIDIVAISKRINDLQESSKYGTAKSIINEAKTIK